MSTKEKILAAKHLGLAEATQAAIAAANGGWHAIKEADEGFNNATVAIVTSMVGLYGTPVVGKFNYYDNEVRKDIVEGKKSPFFAVPERVCTACADYILPAPTAETQADFDKLAGLIRYWNASSEAKDALLNGELAWYAKREKNSGYILNEIQERISALDGKLLIWK